MFIVSGVEENFVYIVDGNIHKVENPKYKKIKHIVETEFFNDELAERFKNGNKISNQDVKRYLKSISK